MTRFVVSLLAICALTLAACGGGGAEFPAAEQPVLQASFGSATAPAGITALPGVFVPVTIYNYSNALILDMGYRPFQETGTFDGGLQGHDPLTFGSAQNGGAFWVDLEVGGYSMFIETEQGRIDFAGWTPTVQGPDGSTVPGPANIYLFSSDFQDSIPDPISRPRNPVTPIDVGQITPRR